MQAPSSRSTAPPLQALLTGGALAGEWVLDPHASSVQLKSRSMGLVPVSGVFRELSGNGTVSGGGDVSGSLTVAATSIDTKNPRRDAHLRSADFFDTANNPDITFIAEGVRASGQGVAVTGTLAVRGSSRPLSFEAAVTVPDDGEVWLDAQVIINRADFGLTWNLLGMVSMNTTLTIHAVFSRR
jgi:polyisoprenoid-binding protein YceI